MNPIPNIPGKALLIILDGFGIGKDSPFNGIQNAHMPFYRSLLKNCLHSQLLTHGEAVGLPPGIMGNSEVGHMTIGSGRVIYQDLMRINRAIADHSFFKNEALLNAIRTGARKTGRVHLMGLLSDGGVHSHDTHLHALLKLCAEEKVPEVFIHVFTDGRDTPPDSAPKYIHALLNSQALGKAKIASICGRYFAMDRDQRWERVERAYQMLTGQIEETNKTALEVLHASYQKKITDEFIEPTLLNKQGALRNGDALIFFNFRSDRAREICRAIDSGERMKGGKKVSLSALTTMTQYDRSFAFPTVFPPQVIAHPFGEWLEERGGHQFRIAETEKYAHVTFFFNAGQEKPFQGEDRELVESPRDVATYDLKPEMSAPQVTAEAIRQIESGKYEFVLMNYANGDMVGHTGNYDAVLKAMKTLDACLEKVVSSAARHGYHVLITADHGNAEEMQDCNGQIHTQHTLNPVPLIWVPPGSTLQKLSTAKLKDGTLADILPTLCQVMQLPTPNEVTGSSLIYV